MENLEDPPSNSQLGSETHPYLSLDKRCPTPFPDAITSFRVFTFVKGEVWMGRALPEIRGKINSDGNTSSQPSAVFPFIVVTLPFAGMVFCLIVHPCKQR